MREYIYFRHTSAPTASATRRSRSVAVQATRSRASFALRAAICVVRAAICVLRAAICVLRAAICVHGSNSALVKNLFEREKFRRHRERSEREAGAGRKAFGLSFERMVGE